MIVLYSSMVEENFCFPSIVMAYMRDCKIIVSRFKPHSCYYFHFWEKYDPPYPHPNYRLNSAATILL